MNFFFGHDVKLAQEIDWFFNVNHLFLVCIVASVVLGLYFALHAKTQKGQRVTKLVLAGIMLVLEISRLIYAYSWHMQNGGTVANFNWWWEISFQMCAIMSWLTIITLIVSAFVKKDNKIVQVFYNILFGVAMIGGILTFTYPDCINGTLPLLHFENVQTIIQHSLLILAPLYLIKVGDLKVRFKNIWMPALGFLGNGCLAMTASLLSGQNFSFMLKCDLFELVGLNIAFPWHLPLLIIIVFALTIIVYGIGELVYFIKHRKDDKIPPQKIVNKNYFAMSVVSFVIAGVQSMIMLLLISGAFIPAIKNGLASLVCLLPILVAIAMVMIGVNYKRRAYGEKFTKNNQIACNIIMFICNILIGIWNLVFFLKENKK